MIDRYMMNIMMIAVSNDSISQKDESQNLKIYGV